MKKELGNNVSEKTFNVSDFFKRIIKNVEEGETQEIEKFKEKIIKDVSILSIFEKLLPMEKCIISMVGNLSEKDLNVLCEHADEVNTLVELYDLPDILNSLSLLTNDARYSKITELISKRNYKEYPSGSK